MGFYAAANRRAFVWATASILLTFLLACIVQVPAAGAAQLYTIADLDGQDVAETGDAAATGSQTAVGSALSSPVSKMSSRTASIAALAVDLYDNGAVQLANSGGAVPMYRLYNPNSGEHFYTSNTAERDNLKNLGWRYEGVGWYAPKKSSTPVYRAYNKNAGDHHYTTSKSEYQMLRSKGWKGEGIGWYSDDSKTMPVYRQYNPNAYRSGKSGAHNYTVSKVENANLVKLGWKGEGIGWYGLKVQVWGNPNAARFYERQVGYSCESYSEAFAMNAALDRKATSGQAIIDFRPEQYKRGGNAYYICLLYIQKYFPNELEFMGFDKENASPQLLADLIKEGWMVSHCTTGRYQVFRSSDGSLRYNGTGSGHEICFYAYNETTRTFYAADSVGRGGAAIEYSWNDIINFNKVSMRYHCFRAK